MVDNENTFFLKQEKFTFWIKMATKMDDARPDTVNTKVVVALDFGTTCTGYAYYYKTGSRDYLDSINYEQSWTGAANVSMQAPTTVLMTPDKKFHSFGCEAEKKYESLALKNEHRDWFFFRHFKMELHHKHVRVYFFSFLFEHTYIHFIFQLTE